MKTVNTKPLFSAPRTVATYYQLISKHSIQYNSNNFRELKITWRTTDNSEKAMEFATKIQLLIRYYYNIA